MKRNHKGEQKCTSVSCLFKALCQYFIMDTFDKVTRAISLCLKVNSMNTTRKKTSKRASKKVKTADKNNLGKPERKFSKRAPKVRWSKEEDMRLQQIVINYKKETFSLEDRNTSAISWKVIAERLTGTYICQFYSKYVDINNENFEILNPFGCTTYLFVVFYFNQARTGKQCRERWSNHVNPNIKTDPWTEEEEALIVKLQREKGNRYDSLA